MKSQSDVLFDELIAPQIDQLLEDDAFYEAFATKLKPQAAIKADHRRQIVEFLKIKDLRESFIKAEQLIREHLPKLISPGEYTNFTNEFDNSINYFIEKTHSAHEEEPITLQKMFGLSNTNIFHIFELARNYTQNKQLEDAKNIFILLTMISPTTASFWLALGTCFQALGKDAEAIEIFQITKTLNPKDPSPFIYAAESYLRLKNREKAQKEIETASPLFQEAEKGSWQESLQFVQNILKNERGQL